MLTTNEELPLVVTAAALLANDTGPALTLQAVSNATNGSVVLSAGSVTFTPNTDFAGTAGFDYTVVNGGGSDTGHVTVTVTQINDAPVALNGGAMVDEGTTATLTLSCTDVDSPMASFAIGTPPTHGTLGAITPVTAFSATVPYTPAAGYVGPDSLTFTANDGALSSAPATLMITVNNVVVCGDGIVEAPETCDDNNFATGDGCSAACNAESGWSCTGTPSTCTPICGDGQTIGTEQCDDMNMVDTDGCTSACRLGHPCNAAAVAGGDGFATDPLTGTCYAMFASEPTTFASAQSSCVALGGYLVTITSATEQARVVSILQGIPWIGAADDSNDTDAVFDWVTTESWGFTAFAPGEPDDDAAFGGNGECLAMIGTNGTWGDTNCNFVGFTDGRVCELPLNPCGDGVVHPGETCDDGNTTSGDGCSASCGVEAGATCSGTPSACGKLVINEIDYDNPGTDNSNGQYEFIELLNVGTGPVDLTNLAVVLLNGGVAPPSEYFFDGTTGAANVSKRLRLTMAGVPANQLPPGGIVVFLPAGQPALPTTVFSFTFAPPAAGFLQNGAPDAVALFDVSTSVVVDALSYEGSTAPATITGVTGTFTVTETAGHAAGDPGVATESLQRFPNGRDTGNNSTDFAARPRTPGLAN